MALIKGTTRQILRRYLREPRGIGSVVGHYILALPEMVRWGGERILRRGHISENTPSDLKILFMTSRARVREAKLAYALGLYGIKVILLCKTQEYDDQERACFHSIVSFRNVWDALRKIDSVQPDVVHLFANYDNARLFPTVALACCPVVYDPYDIVQGVISKPEYDFHGTEKWAEKFCFEKADRLCCRSLEAKFLEKRYGYRIARPLYFPDYCWSLPKSHTINVRPGEVKVVYAGGVYPENLFPREELGYAQFLAIAQCLASQSIHFHIYPANPVRGEQFQQVFDLYIKESRNNSYFHFHNPVPHHKLMEELQRYDFALHVFGVGVMSELGRHSPEKFTYSTSNRLFDYMQAGLPIIIHSGRHGKGLVRHYGVAVELGHLDELSRILPRFHNISFPEKRSATIQYHAHRLRDMYTELYKGQSLDPAAVRS